MKQKITIETLKIQYTAFFHYIRNGVRKIKSKPWKYPYPILHILLAVFIINKIPKVSESDIWVVSVLKTTILILAIMVAVFTFIYIIVRIGKPFKTKNVHINLYKIGLVNRFGDIPTLVDKYKLGNSKNVFVYKFLNNGISLEEFESKKERIESSLNKNVIKMEYGKNKKEILMYVYSGNQVEFKTIPWEDKYLMNDDFVITLGESPLEQITMNRAVVPHILLGGASGSGKSVLLKVILNYISLFSYLFISYQMSAKPYFIGSTGIFTFCSRSHIGAYLLMFSLSNVVNFVVNTSMLSDALSLFWHSQ